MHPAVEAYNKRRSDRKAVVAYRARRQERLDGGPGSGNFGHAGRPGEIGGSSGSGGVSSFSTGAAGDEVYMRSEVKDGKRTAGYMDWSEWRGTPSVKYIQVEPGDRGKGLATKMLQDLQRKYPDTEINFGMTTPDGTKLLDAITYEKVDPEVKQKTDRLARMNKDLDACQQKLDRLFEIEEPTEKQQAEINSLGDKWQDLYDGINDLKKEVEGQKPVKRLVKLDSVREDAEPTAWITVNGNHIPIDAEGNAIGGQMKALGDNPNSGMARSEKGKGKVYPIKQQTNSYRNPYVSDAERADFKNYIKQFKGSWGFQSDDPKSYVKLGKQIQDEVERRFKLRRKNGTAEDKEDKYPQTKDIYDVLQDIRSFGPPEGTKSVTVHTSELPDERTKMIFEEACGRFPSDWFSEYSENGCRVNIVNNYGRAACFGGWQYDDKTDRITVFAKESPSLVTELNLEDDNIADYGIANALAHELGHHFENSNPLLYTVARRFLEMRTDGEDLQELYPGEYTKPDKFADPYMGKQYVMGETEITSCLVQKLGYWNPRQAIVGGFCGTEKDYDSYKFILGVLAGDY